MTGPAIEYHHFVQYLLQQGDSARVMFMCTAPENAGCRTFCQTCWDESQERCVCDDVDRKPNMTGGHPCNHLGWAENSPEELYDGVDDTAVRGPVPQPIVWSWEGDYYTWDYATPTAAVIDAAHIDRQRAWSEATFGPYPRLQGVIDHIRKELVEVVESGGDLSEWVDVLMLAFDGACGSGASSQEIIDAFAAKLGINQARKWPDWRTADRSKAIEHVRA
ncbi:hypothetical protein BH11ACT6_BH11ACT6_34730 [soil metagenome]